MTHTCLACGHDGADVSMRLIAIPPAEQRTVQVAVPVAETRRGPIRMEYRDVPERFATEPRCHDVKACAERFATNELDRLAAPDPLDSL